MEICLKLFFDETEKEGFSKAKKYLNDNKIGPLAYTGRDFDDEGYYYIETYGPITQDQLNGLTALCPIKTK